MLAIVARLLCSSVPRVNKCITDDNIHLNVVIIRTVCMYTFWLANKAYMNEYAYMSMATL